ncbi:MAG: DUF4139 domain-containing protein [Treponema sp.]|nr:DUF4139 domain-containing protein [Treponema sp.]
MKRSFAFLLLCFVGLNLWAQSNQVTNTSNETTLPLKRIVILTSGLAYYEHSGTVDGNVSINLPFRLDAVNDALKSLVINDRSTTTPSITYQSENTLVQTLRSLSIDLSDSPDMATILSRLRGSEVEILSPTLYTGRIAGIEYRYLMSLNQMGHEPILLLSTEQGLRTFSLKDISSIKFIDPVIERDLNRALDLIAASRNSFSRHLTANLPGSGRRDVSISYVIPSPVWKVSYRLDLGASRPLFQGWAIVDNDSDNDWNNVSLSLVAGRPTSFIQELYPPYYVWRPVLPLAIAGTAQAATHDVAYTAHGYDGSVTTLSRQRMEAVAEMDIWSLSAAPAPVMEPNRGSNVTGGTVQTAAASAAGGQFEFTIRNPVSLNRRMSAMFPLVESNIETRRLLIYSGSGRHPRLGAEITNTSNMKLPAGPITVYDGGVYAGDALLEFWNEGEKRLISFGDDLSVTAVTGDTNTRVVSSVTVSGGVMTINRNQTFTRTYTFVNSGSTAKNMIVEHNKTPNTDLVSPNAAEQTATAYRFNVSLPANRETLLTVNERRPLSERITLLSLRPDVFLSYTTNQEIPQNVRRALQRAVELKQAVDAAELAVRDIDAQRNRLIADQDRVRRNLEAAGSQTQQGQEYLRRLTALDTEIDALRPNHERATANARSAQQAYENYVNGLNL